MFKGSAIATILLAACVDTPVTSGRDGSLEDDLAEAGLLGDPMVRDALASVDAPSLGHNPESCAVALGAITATEATALGHITCIGQAVAIVQVGAGTTWGGSDSLIVDCNTDFAMVLPLSPAHRAAGVWAMIDTLEWPFTMDDSDITHCGTAGSPPQ